MLTLPTSDQSNKPVVIGIYGLPASGKTRLARYLDKNLSNAFQLFEGSEVIAGIVPGGLPAFREMSPEEKKITRRAAIHSIRDQCARDQKIGFVLGHFSFRDEDGNVEVVWADDGEGEVFTHILHLTTPAKVIEERTRSDNMTNQRHRRTVDAADLKKWQDEEIARLRSECTGRGILFALVRGDRDGDAEKISSLMTSFSQDRETHNTALVKDIVLAPSAGVETSIVLDGDRTLVEEDTGALFWDLVKCSLGYVENDNVLKDLFGGPLGYSSRAFQQQTLRYRDIEVFPDVDFDAVCDEVAAKVRLRDEFELLLKEVSPLEHIHIFVITCGLQPIWRKIMDNHGFLNVSVIGNNRSIDSLVITPPVKAGLVSRLRDAHQSHVWVFGDSPLDLAMMSAASEAVVVVGEGDARSSTMDGVLKAYLHTGNLQGAKQVLIPATAEPRLTGDLLPITSIDPIVHSILNYRSPASRIREATGLPTAKLLMTPMRDQQLQGPALRDRHEQCGWYLATEFIGDILGLETFTMTSAQGVETEGYRIKDESNVTIVAAMRGGEPMAFGVSRALPKAWFLHAKNTEDLTEQHLEGKEAVIVVDSVINNGTTMIEFVEHIRKSMGAQVPIVLVAGVVQNKSLIRGKFAELLERDRKLFLVMLRQSQNKYTGVGGSDTGHRLFNTTKLD